MENCDYVGVVRVHGEYQDSAWVITSENLPGFFLAGEDLERLRADVPTTIQMLYRLNYGMEVEVRLAGEPGEKNPVRSVPQTWAAVPVRHVA